MLFFVILLCPQAFEMTTAKLNQTKILEFWFHDCKPKKWFLKDKKFDLLVKDKFYNLVILALDYKLNKWEITQYGSLALILLLDQFTRNIFRDSPLSFAGDSRALSITLNCLRVWKIKDLQDIKRQFLLMPMMHSEDIKIQDKSLPLFKSYTNDSVYKFAIKHRNIIYRFGRFPHRNNILNRKSTDEEIEFLKQKGSSF